MGRIIKMTDAVKLSISTSARATLSLKARHITASEIINAITQANLPTVENNPAISPPNAYPPQIKP